MEGWGPASQDQVTRGHPVWLLSMDSASASWCGDMTGWQCQAYPAGPIAQGWHLHLAQPWAQEVLRDHNLSPELQPKSWGHPRRDGPSPDTRVTLSTPPGTPGSLGGCWVIPGAALRLCPCSQVLDLEVWEQVSAGTLCQAGLGWGEGQICLVWAGGLPRGLPCPTCPPARGCSEGGWL